jgi:hypothetical protein
LYDSNDVWPADGLCTSLTTRPLVLTVSTG